MDAVETAYFGCPNCGHEIEPAARIDKAYFRCRKTGLLLREYLESIQGKTIESKTSSIELSPLLRDTGYNLASKIIKDGLFTANPDNWQQQSLGLPSETTTTQLSPALIKRAIAAPKPEGEPNFTLAGIDQGRSEHWLTIVDFYLAADWTTKSYSDLCETTIRVVRWCGGIQKGEIRERLDNYRVAFGIVDNEPDRADASRLCEWTGVLEMADQQPGALDDYKQGRVRDGGDEFPCWKIRSEKFMKQVLYGFTLSHQGYPLYRCPDSWEQWLHNPNERSPIKHLCSPSYNPETGLWVRAADHVDDIFYAFHFCEAAFAIFLRDHTSKVLSDRAFGFY